MDVNPVTGQFYEKEDAHVKDLETEEEKLKEAERLFVLFERLKLKGVINVTNPVELAIQNGSFFA